MARRGRNVCVYAIWNFEFIFAADLCALKFIHALLYTVYFYFRFDRKQDLQLYEKKYANFLKN
jgi:hypothetical protein